MLRKALPIFLLGALLAAGTVGCAVREETVALPSYRSWTKIEARQIVNAKPEEPPKLLPVTHFSAGQFFERQGRLQQAIDQYRKAIQLNTRFAAAYNRLGLCYLKLGQHAEAIQALKKAVSLQPKAAYLRNNLAFAYLLKGDYRAAERLFREALTIKPAFKRARMNLAICLVKQGRETEALAQLKTVAPEHVAWYNLGQMLLACGRAQRAAQAFEKSLALKSDFQPARARLNEVLAVLEPSKEQATAEAPKVPATQRAVASSEVRQDKASNVAEPTAAEAKSSACGRSVSTASCRMRPACRAPASRPAVSERTGAGRDGSATAAAPAAVQGQTTRVQNLVDLLSDWLFTLDELERLFSAAYARSTAMAR